VRPLRQSVLHRAGPRPLARQPAGHRRAAQRGGQSFRAGQSLRSRLERRHAAPLSRARHRQFRLGSRRLGFRPPGRHHHRRYAQRLGRGRPGHRRRRLARRAGCPLFAQCRALLYSVTAKRGTPPPRGDVFMADSADRIALSTWSLHRLLGSTYPHDLTTDAVGEEQETYGEGSESLLGLPSVMANHGYHRLEIVSFHLRSRDPVYLGELRDQLEGAAVRLQTLLIDAGDMTDPVHGARDTRWIGAWLDVAHELGAGRARTVAGQQPPTPDTLART